MTANTGRDPYKTLGVRPSDSDEQLRSAYRRLVRLHHPDHNGGSLESTRRFEEIQEAYAQITEQRRKLPPRSRPAPPPPPPPPVDPKLDARIANMERDLRDAYLARERAQRAARAEAAKAAERPPRPSDEELGYFTTDDSLSKILSDARDELAKRLGETREHPVVKRVEDLIEELDERLRPRRPRE